jgi:hypothetical protein
VQPSLRPQRQRSQERVPLVRLLQQRRRLLAVAAFPAQQQLLLVLT